MRGAFVPSERAGVLGAILGDPDFELQITSEGCGDGSGAFINRDIATM